MLPLFRVPGEASYYCLRHRKQFSNYHQVHVEQMGFLYERTGDPYYIRLKDLLFEDHPYDGS